MTYEHGERALAALRRWLNRFWDDVLAAFRAEVEIGASKPKDQDK
jgi:hypothetical protein